VSPASAARRFARALLEVAEKQKASERLDGELAEFARAFGASDELRRALSHPAVPNDKKTAVVNALCRDGSDLLKGILKILVEHHEALLIPAVAAAFHEALNVRKGIASAEAYSAVPLDGSETKALEAALKKTAGREVELVTRVEPGLLGGVLVRMGGRTYDGSVRSHLRGLRNVLAGVGES
jgi:F-type H+-transporting ATPase subunit delta